MQVFVPFPDIKQSVQCLDNKQLGNQIYQKCLTIARGKWPNHPVSKMWYNHTYFLCQYAFAGLEELSYRGKYYADTFDKLHQIAIKCRDTGPPIWWGDMRVHLSHQYSLLRKDPDHYKEYFEGVPPQEYYWPEHTKVEILKHGKKYQEQQASLPYLNKEPLTK